MCALSAAQKFWYKRLLLKDSAMLAGLERSLGGSAANAKGTGGEWRKLQSLMVQLRKCCNHPFLFPGAEAAVCGHLEAVQRGGATEHLVTCSGKMRTLDRLLAKLKAKGHRVVLFSQYTRMLARRSFAEHSPRT